MNTASQTPLHISLNPARLSALKSPMVAALPFITHTGKRGFSIKTGYKSHRLKPRAAAGTALNNPYAASLETETLYELLGLPDSGTPTEIKRAYKQLALKYHPDVSPVEREEENTRKFIRIQEAYEILSDPETRALYDSDVANGLHLTFSGRKGIGFDERSRSADKSGWKDVWESQLGELKKRSATRNRKVDSRGRQSWGSRIRSQQEMEMSE